MKLKDIIWVLFISMLPLIELRGAIPVGTALGLPFYINYALSVLGNLLPVPFILLFIPKILDFLERFKLFRPVVLWLHKKADKNRGKIAKSKENAKAPGLDSDAELNSINTEKSISELNGINTEESISALNTTNSEENASELNTTNSEENASELNTDSVVLSQGEFNAADRKGIMQSSMPAGAFIGLLLFVLLPLPGTGAWTGALVAALFGFPRLKSFISIMLGVLGCGVIMCLASYGVLGALSFLL